MSNGRKRLYDKGEMCLRCQSKLQIVKKLCRSCYMYYRQHPDSNINKKTCKGCERTRNIYAHDLCKTCYYKTKYIMDTPLLKERAKEQPQFLKAVYCKESTTHCTDCGVSFTQKPKLAKNLCTTCYNNWTKKNKTNICQYCNLEMDSYSVRAICASCKSHKPTKRKNIPDEKQKQVMKILLVKAKWNLLNEVDMFRVIDVYLQVVGYDDYLARYTERGCIGYCLLKFQNWV